MYESRGQPGPGIRHKARWYSVLQTSPCERTLQMCLTAKKLYLVSEQKAQASHKDIEERVPGS